jgi:hypothetical protein
LFYKWSIYLGRRANAKKRKERYKRKRRGTKELTDSMISEFNHPTQ